MGLGFPALFFCVSFQAAVPNNCSPAASHARSITCCARTIVWFFTWTGLWQPDLPGRKLAFRRFYRTIVHSGRLHSQVDPDSRCVTRRTCNSPNNCTVYNPRCSPIPIRSRRITHRSRTIATITPRCSPDHPDPAAYTGKSPNNSPTVCPPRLSNYAILWVSR